MGKNGKLLNLNSDSPKYGNKSLVTKEQELQEAMNQEA